VLNWEGRGCDPMVPIREGGAPATVLAWLGAGILVKIQFNPMHRRKSPNPVPEGVLRRQS